MSGQEYTDFHARLVALGWKPVTSPDAYSEAHYLPLAYPNLEGETPRTLWIEGRDEDAAWSLYREHFQAGDAIFKDWVKSAKHRWREACFLPAKTDRERFAEVFANFLEERSVLFEKGVVLREFHPFRVLWTDTGGMPVHAEMRLFFWDGDVLLWPEGAFPDTREERLRWCGLARRFASRFLSIDVACDDSGKWSVVETGDGQVSGLLESVAPSTFYAALRLRKNS